MAHLIPSSTLQSHVSSPLHSRPLQKNLTPGDVGILKSTLLPSFGLYSSLSLATYFAAEATNRVELKDWLWPSAQVLNAWWSAIGQNMYKHGHPFRAAWDALPWTEQVLLSCVTIWGTRLFSRIASRSLSRDTDDARYEAVKKEPGFWKSAFVKIFLPEALILSVISFPFTLPFNTDNNTLALGEDARNIVRALGVGVFGAGLAMEVLADTQLELHRRERTDLCRHGVWGLVRHPKYVLWREGCNCYMDLLMIVQLSGRHIDSFLFYIA
jgi:steroid 5-alpha reductase family enzyme